MSNYTKTTDFEAKDSLPSGDSGKIIRGSEFETEFDNIATAIASKSDANNPTFTGTVTIDGLTVNGNTVLGNAATDTVTVTADIASNLLPSADDTYNLGAVGAEWNDLFIDGVANIDSLVADTADINGGTVDGVTIGGSSAGAITGTAISGTSFASTGDMTFGDNDKAIFGNGSDLEIYHDPAIGSIIEESGAGQLFIRGGNNVQIESNAGENMAIFNENADVKLYYDNLQKFATTSTGIDVTGVITTDGMTTSADINFGDNDKAVFGADSDLQIYHDGSNSVIQDFGTGNLNIIANEFALYEGNGTDLMIGATPNGAVTLSHNALTKLATTSTGIDVTGTVTSDGLTVDADGNTNPVVLTHSNTGATLRFENTDQTVSDGQQLSRIEFSTDDAGTERDQIYLQMTGNGTGGSANFDVMTGNGTPVKRASFDVGGDISFYEDTGTTAKLFWDASAESLGIGTTTSTSTLNIQDGTPAIRFYDSNLTTRQMEINAENGNAIIKVDPNQTESTSYFSVEVDTDEAMRIDSSGNVLVGTTSSAVHNLTSGGGFNYLNGSFLCVARQDNPPFIANRTSSDGVIQQFRKDGTTVGSIGSFASDITLGKSACGLRFEDGTETIRPHNVATNTSNDASVTLGNSDSRFKDLYLSGGAYLGGTAAANKLDDYEEGTWTPEIADATSGGNTGTYTNNGCFYTKIGRAVYIHINISSISTTGMTGSNTFYIRNLPFTSKGGTNRYIGVAQVPNPTFTGEPILNNAGSSSYLRIMDSGTNADLTVSAMTGLIYGSIMYPTP